MIHAMWCVSNNVGDSITHWLIKKITGSPPIFVERDSYHSHIVACGSILNWANRNSIVWGAGIANKNDIINTPHLVTAVRGPRSAARLAECTDFRIELFGDPALLLPLFYNPNIEVKYAIGIIPHYVDQEIVYDSNLTNHPEIKIIDVFSSVTKFVDDVKSCDAIFSSSLHGLIIAHAYGKPARWFEAGNRIGGDQTKYFDYLESVDINPYCPVKLYNMQYCNQDTLSNMIGIFNAKVKQQTELLNVCPFRQV